MATSIVITCPQCQKQSKAPAEVQGKKIKCKACEHVFVVRAPGGKAGPPPAPAKPGKGKPAQTTEGDLKKIEVKSLAQEMIEDEFKDDSNPYGVTDMDLRPRCPHCAGEIEEGQVICLVCGYNTRTRMHGVTVRVYGATFFERALWLLPGIACVLAVGGLIALIVYLWMGLRGNADKDPSSWLWWFFDNFPTQVYGTAVSLALIWFAGMFAVKRLILNPNPPEKVKRNV